jgi:hypothetical protein
MCNWPASASDQTIFDASSFAQNPRKFLKQQEEFIFTDLGFKKEVFAVPPYKGKEAKLEHNALFNKAQRGGRTKVLLVLVLILWNVTREQVEHANGVIKARFASLRKMPIEIRSDADMLRCAVWITACVVLHNILIHLRDEVEYVDVPFSDIDEDDAIKNQPTPQAKVF